MSEKLILRPRLAAIADMVRSGCDLLLDIGTDHALLPTYLVLHGIVRSAVASDIAQGPLQRAEGTVRQWGVESSVQLHLGDGLSGLCAEGVTDIVIAGMGGEAIIDILNAAPFTKDPDIRLILQPMTRADVLRKWLGENGYNILDERLCPEEEKLYQILLVSFDGIPRTPSAFCCAVGEKNLLHKDENLKLHLSRLKSVYLTRAAGKESANQDASHERSILCGIDAALEDNS